MLESRNYVQRVGTRIRHSINGNLAGWNRFCGSGRRCGGTGWACSTNADCPGTGCYPNVRTGTGLSFKICQYQSQFRSQVSTFCTNADIAALGFPSPLCPSSTTPLDVVNCILENNASARNDANIVDTTFEPYRRGATHIEVPHPPGFGSYPAQICGVPGSYLLDIGTAADNLQSIGREGGWRPTHTDGCSGDVCDTKGDSVADFGNLREAPMQTYVGGIPVCILQGMTDAGNGTFQDGTINLTTGEQHSFEPITITPLIGTTCPICTAGVCDSGPLAGQACGACGEQSFACPPTIVGGPPVIPVPLNLTTEAVSMSVPAHNPGAGVTNPAGAFCGACDLDDRIGCNNDSVCVTAGVCSGSVGSGCCEFGTNIGFGRPSCQPVTAINLSGARGPFIPHLAGVLCMGKSGNGLIDTMIGLPGPLRIVEPRVNTFAW